MSLSVPFTCQVNIIPALIPYLHFRLSWNFCKPMGWLLTPGGVRGDTNLASMLKMLLSASLSPATKLSYKCSLLEFASVAYPNHPGHCVHAPSQTYHMLLFIAALFNKGLALPSIQSKLSAVSFWHHLHGWINPGDSFLVRKCLLGI